VTIGEALTNALRVTAKICGFAAQLHAMGL
jgi:hypothetical protein